MHFYKLVCRLLAGFFFSSSLLLFFSSSLLLSLLFFSSLLLFSSSLFFFDFSFLIMVILVDNGHGFDTKGKCSPDGKYQEWAWAREMANLIVRELVSRGFDARLVVPEREDVAINTGADSRVKRVNAICDRYGRENVILLSIHSNANSCDGRWHDGEWSGFVAEVSLNASERSKWLADFIWGRAIEAGLKGNRGVVDKRGMRFIQQNLGICRDTKCVAVLTESAFHDTREGVKLLLGSKQRIMLAHVEGIMDYINYITSVKS
ncbi:MAG: N-acetylmuramoyl-L-alanine amidase [Bacteroides sp.]|nr:N-acetylmuramoyl-L-alanine amidase [Bacteroides sp.]